MSKFFSKLSKILICALFISSVIVLILSFYFTFQSDGKLVFTKEVPKESALLKNYAYISGQVNNPGVYEINSATRVIDLINLAAGFTENADPDYINNELNLSRKVQNEDHIFINSKITNSSQPSKTSNLINLNTATISELMQLPGIGESTGQKIIENRPYLSIEELLDVPGIGESKFNQVKHLVSLE